MDNYLEHYNKDYFLGGSKSGYADYDTCAGVIYNIYNLTLKALEYRPDTYLDVGCAYGFTVDVARRRNTQAWGVEPETYALEVAKKKPWGKYIIGDKLPDLAVLKEMPEFSHGVDLVTAYEVLEHIPEEEIAPSLTRMLELANKYLVILPNMGEPPPPGFVDPHVVNDVTHISMKPREWWMILFKELDIEKLRDKKAEEIFNKAPYSKHMFWDGRFFVFKK